MSGTQPRGAAIPAHWPTGSAIRRRAARHLRARSDTQRARPRPSRKPAAPGRSRTIAPGRELPIPDAASCSATTATPLNVAANATRTATRMAALIRCHARLGQLPGAVDSGSIQCMGRREAATVVFELSPWKHKAAGIRKPHHRRQMLVEEPFGVRRRATQTPVVAPDDSGVPTGIVHVAGGKEHVQDGDAHQAERHKDYDEWANPASRQFSPRKPGISKGGDPHRHRVPTRATASTSASWRPRQ